MNFVLHMDKTVPTLLGHTFEFKKGVPLNVPRECHAAVMAVGAVPTEDIVEEKAPEDLEALSMDEKAKRVEAAIAEMLTKPDRNDFTASGTPHLKVLSEKVGFKVDTTMRDEAWVELHKVN
jgi:hypothetical protein